MDLRVQRAGLHLQMQKLIDPLLQGNIAWQKIGLLAEIKGLIRMHAAQFGMQPVLQSGFCGIGDHHIGTTGDQFVENAGVVGKDDNLGVVQVCAIKCFIGAAMRRDDMYPRLVYVR